MKELTKNVLVIVIILGVFGCAASAYAWDVEYNADNGLLPTAAAPAWQLQDGATTPTLDSGALHISSVGGGYSREQNAISASVPVTVETYMRVQSDTYNGASLEIGTYNATAGIGIFPDHIVAGDVHHVYHIFDGDFTAFHTLRLAYDGTGQAYLWVDDQPALSWATSPWSWQNGFPDGVRFGSYLCNSYWQYVDYSKQFLPVPEPSCLLALATSILGTGLMALKRKPMR